MAIRVDRKKICVCMYIIYLFIYLEHFSAEKLSIVKRISFIVLKFNEILQKSPVFETIKSYFEL